MIHITNRFLYIVIFTVLSCIFINGNKLDLDLKPSDMRCIGQELDQEDQATFLFSGKILKNDGSKGSNNFIAKIIHPITEDEIYSDKIILGAPDREFKLNIEERGVYQLCFESTSNQVIRVSFGVDFKNRSNRGGQDPSKKIGKDDLPTMETELKNAEISLNEISKEIDFARRQERALQEAGETTSSRIQWFSVLSIVILLSTSIWQITYLRSFFVSKKLL